MIEKVRAEFFVDPKREDSHRYIITIVIGDGYWQRMRDLTKAEALLIAERINSDPAEIAEKAKKEERERIEGIIAEMGDRFSRSNDYLEVVNIQQRVLLAIKSEIAKE